MYVAVSDGRAEGAGPDTSGMQPASASETSDPALDGLPAPVRRQLGRPVLAMTLDLDENRRLGQEDIREVLANLASQGFHVQMPRDIEPLVEEAADAAISTAAARHATGRGEESES